MKKIVSLLAAALMLFTVLPVSAVPRAHAFPVFKPMDSVSHGGHSYYCFTEDGVTWSQAVAHCVSLGGHMASITSKAENTFLFDYTRGLGYECVYFGLTDEASEGTWVWVSGETSSYRNWNSAEPTNYYNEDYAMFYYMYPDGTWNDGAFCTGDTWHDTTCFLCEWDFLFGDADRSGKVDTTDALLVLRCALSLGGDPESMMNCDMDENDVIDTVDALLVLRRALGIG